MGMYVWYIECTRWKNHQKFSSDSYSKVVIHKKATLAKRDNTIITIISYFKNKKINVVF